MPQGQVTGFDVIAQSIEDANALKADCGVKNAHFVQGDAKELARFFPDTRFDVVHAHFTLLHIPDPVPIVKQMRSLLKPGGFLAIRDAISTFTYPPELDLESTLLAWRAVGTARGAHPEGGLYNHTWLHQAGFPWEKIQWGPGSHEITGEGKKIWVATQNVMAPNAAQQLDDLDLMHVVGLKKGDKDKLVKRWLDAWAKFGEDPSLRFINTSGWVIGWL